MEKVWKKDTFCEYIGINYSRKMRIEKEKEGVEEEGYLSSCLR